MATNGTICSHYKSSQFWHVTARLRARGLRPLILLAM
jgi:hypothetical protein